MKEPPDYKQIAEDIITAILIIGLGSLITWFFLIYMSLGTEPPKKIVETYLSTYPAQDLSITQGNSLVSISPLPFLPPIILGNLTSDDEFERIVFCESTNNPTAQNPISSAFGYCQMLKSTRDYVEKKWEMKIDWEDPREQLYACRRLYEEEGEIHWLASKSCWDK